MRSGLALRSVNDEAAALWRAPGRAHSAMPEFQRTVIPLVATFGTALPPGLKVQGGIDPHRPTARFWYLPYVGERHGEQGKGRGGGVIRKEGRRDGDEWVRTGSSRGSCCLTNKKQK